VKHIYGTGISQRVDRAKCAAAMVLDDFHYSRSAEARQRLRVPVPASSLGDVEGIANMILDWFGELA